MTYNLLNSSKFYTVQLFIIVSYSFSEHDTYNRSMSLSKPEDLDAVEADWIARSGTISVDKTISQKSSKP